MAEKNVRVNYMQTMSLIGRVTLVVSWKIVPCRKVVPCQNIVMSLTLDYQEAEEA